MILQGSFSVIAKSEAMMADTMAMSVDAFTYLFNLGAERLKHRHSKVDKSHEVSNQESARRRKVFRLYLEFIPPLLSVSALIVVSIQALREATHTIMISYQSRDEVEDENEDTPNVNLMLCFSALNLMLDIFNVTCFAKADNFSIIGMDNLGKIKLQVGSKNEDDTDNLSSDGEDSAYNNNLQISCLDFESGTNVVTEKNQLLQNETVSHYGSNELSVISMASTSISNENMQQDENSGNIYQSITNKMIEDDISEGSDDNDSDISNALSKESRELNLNMCSAYTHVMADTLRSIAVLVAAALAFSIKAIDPSIADACASIVVSMIIAISLGPLLAGLIETWKEIVQLRRETEAMMNIHKAFDNDDVFLEEFQHLPRLHGIQ